MNIKNKINVANKVSAQMRAVIDYETANQNSPSVDIKDARQNYENGRRFWNEGGAVMSETLEILVKFNSKDIKTRIYYPNLKDEYGVIFFIHGGGWVVGNLNTHDRIMRNLAFHSGCAVVGIDYSLAPEAKFPTQILECDAVIDYFTQNADKFKLSAKFHAYVGDSAGANICMATFLHRKDSGKDMANLKAMALYYGLYGLRDSASRTLYGDKFDGLMQEDIEYYYEQYLQNKDDENSKLVNIFNADLSVDIPPCFIGACEFDPLKDDSVALYEILKQTSNSEFKEYKGVMHAFLHFGKMLDSTNEAIMDAAKFIKKHFNF